MTTTRSGGCLCGAVRFTAADVPDRFGTCHCPMCRRWTGSALLGVTVPLGSVTWTGEDKIARRQSSGWAERAWCAECGSGLFFKVTAESPYLNEIEIPLGLFNDPSGLTMTAEIYIDHKPDSYAFAGEGRKLLTRADCVAKFARLDSE